MYSILKPEILYTDLSSEIVEHDDDIEVYQWEYDGQTVYRGTHDPRYMKYDLTVYSLYDENLKRIGIVEHDADEPEIYQVLWFYDNPFARFYQNPEWKSTETTIWSMISSDAYQDCLEDDFKTVIERCLSSKYRLVTPEMLIKTPTVYECSTCGKKSLTNLKSCKSVIETPYFLPNLKYLYIDDSFVIYQPPNDHQPHFASYEQEQKEPVIEQADLQESLDEQSLPVLPESH